MRALTVTQVKTSGVTSAYLKFALWDGVLQVANPSYLQKVSVLTNKSLKFSLALWLIIAALYRHTT